MNPDFRFNLLQLAGSPIFDGNNEERIALAEKFEAFCFGYDKKPNTETDASNEKAEDPQPSEGEACTDPDCIVCRLIRPAFERAAEELAQEATAPEIPPEVMKIIETMQAAGYKVSIGELR